MRKKTLKELELELKKKLAAIRNHNRLLTQKHDPQVKLKKEMAAYNKANQVRLWRAWSVPKKVPEGRVIVHNRVHAVYVDQLPGINGFQVWTQLPDPKELIECNCGWSGLPHYKRDRGAHPVVTRKTPEKKNWWDYATQG